MKLRLPAIAAALAGGLVLTACGSDGDSSSAAPATPEGSFCDVVLAWSDGVVGTVNQFGRRSPDASDVAARRSLYLQAWDGLGSLADWVDAAAERAPDAVQSGLHDAAEKVRQVVADGRAHAAALPDDAYEYASVHDGTLLTSNEKVRSVVYRALDDMRGDLGEGVVPTACGRHTEPVTLPVMTAP